MWVTEVRYSPGLLVGGGTYPIGVLDGVSVGVRGDGVGDGGLADGVRVGDAGRGVFDGVFVGPGILVGAGVNVAVGDGIGKLMSPSGGVPGPPGP